MFKYQFKRLYVKHFLAILIILAVLFLGKFVTVKFFYKEKPLAGREKELFDSHVEATIGKSTDEKLEYFYTQKAPLDKKLEEYTSKDEKPDDSFYEELNALTDYSTKLFSNVYKINGVEKYSNTGEGLVSPFVPEDFYYNMEAYTDIDEADVINDDHFVLFVTLQSYNIVPIFVLLIVGLFVADSFEKRVDLQASISKNRKSFFVSQEIVLCMFVGVLVVVNMLVDLAVSGLLTHSYELYATINSVERYWAIPTDMRIYQMIILFLVVEMMGAFICYHIFRISAQAVRSTKKYMVCGLSVIVLTTLVSSVMPKHAIYFFTGITNKGNVINGIKYIPKIHSTNLFIPLIVGVVLTLSLAVYRFVKFKKVR